MNLNKFIESTIREYLNENIQLADKVYFNTGKLSDKDRELILKITNGDNYTKIISDIYFYLKEYSFNSESLIKDLKIYYNDIINYNKNIFPIIGYDIYNTKDISLVVSGFKKRREIIELIKKLPSFAIRNLKNDIRKERTNKELGNYFSNLEYFMVNYSQLSNRDVETQNKILRKIFKSNTTLNDLMKFVDDKQNFIGGVEFTKEDIRELSQTEDFEIIYEQGDVMIIRVDSPNGIKAIGCNSLWCFTYGSGFDSAYRQWNNYSHNDIVYVLVNFREKSDSESFMHVLIKPLTDYDGNLIKYDASDEWDENDHPIFNMSNENYRNPYYILNDLFGKNYINIINKYLNFKY
jgi:hypothetical protein